MAILIVTQTRPSEDIEFFDWRSALPNYIGETYIQTGKIIGKITNNMSEDNLTLTTVIPFRTNEDMIQFRDDFTLNQIRAQKSEYESIHGITATQRVIFD